MPAWLIALVAFVGVVGIPIYLMWGMPRRRDGADASGSSEMGGGESSSDSGGSSGGDGGGGGGGDS